ncbi:MAG: hypothetical protein DCC58_10160 [Chloroflexi bacterium]|nr:MAG: hypothetical protein DCC58_10160 [Chloroflexota bacterium]
MITTNERRTIGIPQVSDANRLGTEQHACTDRFEDLLELCRVLRQTTHQTRRGEMTAEQYWLLRFLHHHDQASVGEIAAALGITQSSATTACQRLERAGLACRQRGDRDERVVRVQLTEEGRTRMQQWLAQKSQALGQFLTPLEPSECDELFRLLHKLLGAEGTT